MSLHDFDFDIRHEELTGFSDYYRVEIFPILAMKEAERASAVKTALIAIGFMILLTVAFIAVIISVNDASVPAVLYPSMACFALSLLLFHTLTKKIRTATKDTIVGKICAYIKWSFKAEVPLEPNLYDWYDLGLLPKIQFASNYRISYEDQINGAAHGAQFQSTEFHVEKKGDKKWHTHMRGQVMSMAFQRKFIGKTVVLRDQKFFQPKTKGMMKRVGLVDPVFEKIFEAYGTDQVEARYLLTPTFMQRLVGLEQSVSGKNICFGFTGGRLLIVVETPNQFEAGSMFTPLTEKNRTQKILNEISAVYHVVDGVMKPQASPFKP